MTEFDVLSFSVCLFVVTVIAIICEFSVIFSWKNRINNIEDEIKSLKRVNGFLFCSFMEHIKLSYTLKGDKK